MKQLALFDKNIPPVVFIACKGCGHGIKRGSRCPVCQRQD